MNKYSVLKLSNGEDIICDVLENEETRIKITSPLKMDSITRTTTKGIVESLSLARWVQPYSDENTFDIEKNSIIIMTPASAGLTRYYEYVLQNINEVVKDKSPTVKQLKQIEKEVEEDLVNEEEIEALLNEFKKKTKPTYH